MQENQEYKYQKALERAARLCSGAEKCSFDIRKKLEDWGLNPEQTDQAIERLQKDKFIDDERYATFFVKDKFRFNQWGEIKIAYALRAKNIKQKIIDKALLEISGEQYSQALDDLIRKKIDSIGGITDQSSKAKVLRFAAQRGFSQEDIFSALERIEKN